MPAVFHCSWKTIRNQIADNNTVISKLRSTFVNVFHLLILRLKVVRCLIFIFQFADDSDEMSLVYSRLEVWLALYYFDYFLYVIIIRLIDAKQANNVITRCVIARTNLTSTSTLVHSRFLLRIFDKRMRSHAQVKDQYLQTCSNRDEFSLRSRITSHNSTVVHFYNVVYFPL